jgi:Skp family chaperone for outer membrane proteins
MKTLIFVILSAVLSTAASASVYRWVDADGQVHYSQFKPAGVTATEQNKPNTNQGPNPEEAKKRLEELRAKLQENINDREKAKKEQAEAKEDKERRKENCEKAKELVRNYEDNGRVYKTLENGERYWYTETERADLIKSSKDQVKKYCEGL